MNMRKSPYLLTVLAICSLLLAQCAPAAPTQPAATQPPAQATEPPAEATEPPAEATAAPGTEDYAQAPRQDTIIFDIDGGKVADPTLWNPFVPGNRRDHGYH